MEVFLEIHKDLPRESPGGDEIHSAGISDAS
jgi:hypothetical protein